MSQEKAVKPFGMADKIGYAFGDFGNDFTFILSSMMLMKFYTDVMGVSAGLVGLMMMLARFVDAVTDVTMGQIVDRSKPTPIGKFKPWIRRMMGPVAVASFLMYASWFANMSMGFKIFWMFFTYILWGSVCYTGVNIPYGSMASAISAEPKDRQSLSTWRSIGASLAGMVIGVVLPMVVYYTDAAGNTMLDGTKMTIAAAGCSIGAVVCYILCTTLTTERVKVEQKTDKFSFKVLVDLLIQNRSLYGIVLAALCLLLATLSLSGMTSYIFANYFKSAASMSLCSIVGVIVTLACSTFVTPLAMKFGKKELSMVGSVIAVAAFLAAFFMHTSNVNLFILFYAVAYLGQAFFSLTCWAMITDVIDDVEVKTGDRSDGTVYAIYSFARKCGQALSSGLTGLLLTMIGYSAATQNDQSVIDGIYNITCLAPMIGFILVIIVLFFVYPLDKKAVEANAAALAAKRNK